MHHKKFFQKNKNNACILGYDVILYGSCRETEQNPGVAKFGIALEWGSRGLEFESRHSDQNREFRQEIPCFFFLGTLRTYMETVGNGGKSYALGTMGIDCAFCCSLDLG